MKKLERLAALLLVITLVVTLFCSVHAFAVAEEDTANVNDAVFYDDAVVGGSSDIDVPFQPAKTLRSISIQAMPSKLTYLQGEELDLTGLVVKAIYIDNSTRIATGYEVSGFDPNVLGEQTVSIALSGKTASFKVTVYAVGDANGDGSVDGNDATLLLQYAAGWSVTIEPLAADANGDGIVDGNDATLMLQYAAGWNVTLG